MNFRYHHYSDTDADTADTDAASATVTSAGGTGMGCISSSECQCSSDCTRSCIFKDGEGDLSLIACPAPIAHTLNAPMIVGLSY